MIKTLTTTHTRVPKILESILQELRILRREVDLLLPHEDVSGYAHPDRIKRSHEKALKQYPPVIR